MIELLIYEIGLVITFLIADCLYKRSLRDPDPNLILETYQSIIFISVFWPYLIPLSLLSITILFLMRTKHEDMDNT